MNKVFYFFIFLNYIFGQGFRERVASLSKKFLKPKFNHVL